MTDTQFRTQIKLPKSKLEINHNLSIITFGSCFSENIGEKLVKSGFDTLINPFGTLYNPISIANSIDDITNKKSFTPDDLIFHNELWMSLNHHSKYSSISQSEILTNINSEIDLVHTKLGGKTLLIITLGSSHVYRYKKSKKIVANCHKIPALEFSKEMLSVDEVVEKISASLCKLLTFNPQLTILFTISPIRYLSDGFFENQHSKAILHLSVSKLMDRFPEVYYFPAFEIMMDDLRDYRFYADDMLHPSPMAVDYIWDQFCKTYFNRETSALAKEMVALHKATEHRPFQKNSEVYLAFLNQQIEKINQMQLQHPQLNLSKLRDLFEEKLSEIG